MVENIFRHWVFKDYILPFLLVFVIVFAILEKTKLLGDGKKQLNAWVAFIVGLVFTAAIHPKEVVSNLVLFLTVSLVVVFVFLLLYGFATGGKEGLVIPGKLKLILGIIVAVAVIVGVIYATGIETGIFEKLFRQTWSESFWTNFLFVVVVVVALALVVRGKKS